MLFTTALAPWYWIETVDIACFLYLLYFTLCLCTRSVAQHSEAISYRICTAIFYVILYRIGRFLLQPYCPSLGHRPAKRLIAPHTHPFNGPLSGTTRVSWYRKGKTYLDFTEARNSEWQWHQLDHMQVCTLLQTDNHTTDTSTPPLLFFYICLKNTPSPPHVCVCFSDNAASVRIRPPLLQQSIDISCPPGPQQQTCSSGVPRPDWTDERADRHRQRNGGPIVAQTLLRILCGQCQKCQTPKTAGLKTWIIYRRHSQTTCTTLLSVVIHMCRRHAAPTQAQIRFHWTAWRSDLSSVNYQRSCLSCCWSKGVEWPAKRCYVGLVAVGVQEQAGDILVPPLLRNCLTLNYISFS